jgi:NlpC/P60 family putative phage cell wall peptidase
MAVARSAFITEARTWLDTPYQHQGRLKGVACDCIGLVICTAQAVGLTAYEPPGYSKRPDGTLRAALEKQLDNVPLLEAQGGDVLLFAFNSVPMHVGILTDADHLIHAYLPNKRVIETRLDDKMRALVVAAYKHPGVY